MFPYVAICQKSYNKTSQERTSTHGGVVLSTLLIGMSVAYTMNPFKKNVLFIIIFFNMHKINMHLKVCCFNVSFVLYAIGGYIGTKRF